ncbi:MAG: SERRATE/Ars2 domain-containing protein [Candidatus Roizmanbacteria bacterium]
MNQPSLSGPLISFKTFMEMQHQHIESEAAQKCYDEYKNEHSKKQADIFFNMHKDEHWFKEKYYPEQAHQWKQEQIAQSKMIAKTFIDNFVDKVDSKCNGLSLDEQANVNYQDMINKESDEVSGAPLFGFDVN